jgi:hypothetical protein
MAVRTLKTWSGDASLMSVFILRKRWTIEFPGNSAELACLLAPHAAFWFCFEIASMSELSIVNGFGTFNSDAPQYWDEKLTPSGQSWYRPR